MIRCGLAFASHVISITAGGWPSGVKIFRAFSRLMSRSPSSLSFSSVQPPVPPGSEYVTPGCSSMSAAGPVPFSPVIFCRSCAASVTGAAPAGGETASPVPTVSAATPAILSTLEPHRTAIVPPRHTDRSRARQIPVRRQSTAPFG
jgi:hypothetical protein